jgi:N6-adenosine-specific RNA methylase IME4
VVHPRRFSELPDRTAVALLLSQHYPGMRKLDMFARKLRPDWDAWGNEAPDGLALNAA